MSIIHTEAIITPDQRARHKKPAISKQSSKQAEVPERLFRFDVAPPPAASAPSTSASAPSPAEPSTESQQLSGPAPSWPFPLVLPGSQSSADLAPSVTTNDSQGLGYEYGPEVYIDRADYWEEATPSNPSFTPKPLAKRQKSRKKSKKSKLCATNGYQGSQAKAGDKMVQVKYNSQRKQWTTNTKEYLSEGGVRRIQVTYHMTVEVEEEHPVDKDGNIVADAEQDTNLNVRPRAGETNIDMNWSSEDETDDNSDSSDSDDTDEKDKKKNKGVSGKSKKHKVQCPKHPGHAVHKKANAVASSESPTTQKKEKGGT
ncbi:MAG: hypothetical protein Q9195_001356 [Heterodermia aff. obscurata]